MRRLWAAGVGIVACLAVTGVASGPGPARAAEDDPPVLVTPGLGPGLVTGPEAREAFDELWSEHKVAIQDFEDVDPGLYKRLDVSGSGGDFAIGLRTTQIRWPLPPAPRPAGGPVAVLPYEFVTEPANHRLMGVAGYKDQDGRWVYSPDGQSRYELVLTPPASHVGLLRMWNTDSLTSFYDEQGRHLATHQNTTHQEFVGYVAARPEERVRRIVLDGRPSAPGSETNEQYQVGEVDDLYLGDPSSGSTVAADPAAAGDTAALTPTDLPLASGPPDDRGEADVTESDATQAGSGDVAAASPWAPPIEGTAPADAKEKPEVGYDALDALQEGAEGEGKPMTPAQPPSGPSVPPPETKPRHQAQGREWASLGADHAIRKAVRREGGGSWKAPLPCGPGPGTRSGRTGTATSSSTTRRAGRSGRPAATRSAASSSIYGIRSGGARLESGDRVRPKGTLRAGVAAVPVTPL